MPPIAPVSARIAHMGDNTVGLIEPDRGHSQPRPIRQIPGCQACYDIFLDLKLT